MKESRMSSIPSAPKSPQRMLDSKGADVGGVDVDVCPACKHAVGKHVMAGCTVPHCSCIAAGVGLRLARLVR